MKKICSVFMILLWFSFAIAMDLSKELESLKNSEQISNDSLFTILSNWNSFPKIDSTDSFVSSYNVVKDTINAPYVLYIPKNYKTTKASPLLVYLHGGVGRSSFMEERVELAKNNPFLELARKNDWLLLIPFANLHCMWWEDSGRNNVKELIVKTKKKYNVEDNKVFVTGVSDGGSGSYHFALTDPSYFASFYPLIGMMSVGNIETQRSVFIPNLQNRFIYAINNEKDRLYPTHKMKKMIEIATKVGANVLYKEYMDFGHDISFIQDEMINLSTFMNSNPRNSFSNKIYWETAQNDYNRCDWLEICKTDTLMEKKKWQNKPNVKLKDERILFGFRNDNSYKKKGVKIDHVFEGNSAYEMGLRSNDIVIEMDEIKTENIDQLIQLRDKKSRGDKYSLTVLRDRKELLLSGQFPEVKLYDAFQYLKRSGAIDANYFGNHFDIKTSRISEFNLYIHPSMVNLDNPITVEVNGKEYFNGKINIDRDFMVSNFEKHFDRTALWVNKIHITLK